MTETAAKKDIHKLQRLIVDALEDVKAHDLQVYDTEHLSPLFERVIIASGTSNRQTKALAASVRDKVRAAGFGKPRIEGEDNGEWIIADCGAAVVHIMQPTIRGYYNLEELWGDKPVRLKLGAPKPEASVAVEKKSAAKKAPAKKVAAGKTVAAKSPAKAPAKSPAKKTTSSAKAPAKSSAKPAAKTAGKPAGKVALKAPAKKAATLKKVVVNAPSKTVAKKSAASKTTTTARKLVRPASRKSV
jgi:ribosome-associated protein